MNHAAPCTHAIATMPRLSRREREVLTEAQYCDDAQIAENLGISRTTVKAHLRSAYTKLGVEHRTAAVVRALYLGLIQHARACPQCERNPDAACQGGYQRL